MNNYLNRVQLIGNVGKDPEIRTTAAGKQMAKFSLATSKSLKNKQTGEFDNVTEWHNIVVFNERESKRCEERVKRGARVYVEGAIKSWKKEEKSGVDIIISAWEGCIKVFDKHERQEETRWKGNEDSHSNEEIPF